MARILLAPSESELQLQGNPRESGPRAFGIILLVDQAQSIRVFEGRGFDSDFEQWATDVRWIAGLLDNPFDIDVDDLDEVKQLPGTTDVDEVMVLLDRLKPAPT